MTFLNNPASGRGKRVSRRVLTLLARNHPDVVAEWVPLQGLDDGAPSGDRVVAIGGDGTVNAAARWLIDHGAAMPMAIVPAGTGNNLASGLGLPLDTEAALDLALGDAEPRPIDAIRYRAIGEDATAEGIFIQSATLGFPARTSWRFDRVRRCPLVARLVRPLGTHVYAVLALAGLPQLKWRERRGYRGIHVRFELAGEKSTDEIIALFLGNERSLGGDFIPTPRAVVDDGLLDLCWVRSDAGRSYLRIFRRFRRGTALELEDAVGYCQTPGPVRLVLSEPSVMMADGELPIEAGHTFEFEVLPHRFEIMRPP